MHFGHCEQFALVETDEESRGVLRTEYVAPPPHEPGVLPRWLHEQGVEVVIAGGMGRRAQMLFAQNSIKVYTGSPAAAPEDLVRDFLADSLETGANACDH
jgi:predicted Fe-Mo cluster-binding NifX family protein